MKSIGMFSSKRCHLSPEVTTIWEVFPSPSSLVCYSWLHSKGPSESSVLHHQLKGSLPGRRKLLCSCKESAEQTARLKSTDTAVAEEFTAFKGREEAQYCIHRSVLPHLHSEDFPVMDLPDDDEPPPSEPVSILSLSPLLAAVLTSKLYMGTSRYTALVYILC